MGFYVQLASLLCPGDLNERRRDGFGERRWQAQLMQSRNIWLAKTFHWEWVRSVSIEHTTKVKFSFWRAENLRWHQIKCKLLGKERSFCNICNGFEVKIGPFESHSNLTQLKQEREKRFRRTSIIKTVRPLEFFSTKQNLGGAINKICKWSKRAN